jgi:hypothetical protein
VPVGEQPAQLRHGLAQAQVTEHLGGPGPAHRAARAQRAQGEAGRAAAQEHRDQGQVRLPAQLAEQAQGGRFDRLPGVIRDGHQVVAALLAVLRDEGQQRPARRGGELSQPPPADLPDGADDHDGQADDRDHRGQHDDGDGEDPEHQCVTFRKADLIPSSICPIYRL